MNNLNKSEIISKIKWMCHDIYITIDKVVMNKDFNVLKEKLNNTTLGYKVNGKFHSKKWINENSVNVIGLISD